MRWDILPRRRKTKRTLKPDGIFEFFKLPAELRNAIYEQLGETICILLESTALRLRSHNIPSQNLRLVSRQFRRELLEQTLPASSMEYEVDAPLWGGKDFLLPPLIRQVPRVAMHLPILCDNRCLRYFSNCPGYCLVEGALKLNSRFSRNLLLQFCQLEHASIHLYLSRWNPGQPVRDEDCQQIVLWHQSAIVSRIADLEDVIDIDVYLKNDETGDGRTVSGEKRLILTYSREAGALVPVNLEKMESGSVN